MHCQWRVAHRNLYMKNVFDCLYAGASLFLKPAIFLTDGIKVLKIWLDGVEEGDVCHGSVKIKAE